MAEPAAAQPSITLTDLVALSEEMAALARSGVPLERGLFNLGQEVPGELGRTAQRLASRLERGEDLADAMAAEEGTFPPVYRVAVHAGMKSGRLAAALEGLAAAARRLIDLRRTVSLAVAYPLIVLLCAYILFVVFVTWMAPQMQAAYEGFEAGPSWLLDLAVKAGETVIWWGPIVPVVGICLAAVWWLKSGQAILVNPSAAASLLGWIPWVGSLLVSSRAAIFSDVLALLLEHRAPLDEALVMAAEASGDPQMIHSARRLATGIQQGQPLTAFSSELPPVLTWLLATQANPSLLVTATRHAAQGYSWQATYQAEKIRILLPVASTLLVGGLVSLLYALMIYAPWAHLLRVLAR